MELTVILVLIVALNLNCSKAATRQPKNDAIKFPEEIAEDIPEKCKGLKYCTTKPHNYPTDKFNNMFKGVNVVVEPSPINEISFENRQGESRLENNCPTKVEFNLMYQVRQTLNSPWRLVVHADNVDYLQRVRLETCLNPGGKCFTEYGEMATFITYCHQKYITYKFLVEKEGNGTEEIDVELPVCCSCHYRPRSATELLGGNPS